MYFRIAPRRQGDRVYKYLQLVEAYREGGKNRQRVLYSFGNLDTLREGGRLGRLIDSLERAAGRRRAVWKPCKPGGAWSMAACGWPRAFGTSSA